jgi:hypothetical protein
MQVKKTKELEPLPSFSFGLTQMEEEERNDTASSSDGVKIRSRKQESLRVRKRSIKKGNNKMLHKILMKEVQMMKIMGRMARLQKLWI